MNQLVAAYSVEVAAEEQVKSWLKLWQKPFSEQVQQAGFNDITAMWYLVMSGLSARQYRASTCPATIDQDGVVTVPLDFYVFPSSLDLQYSLSAGIGTISPATPIEELREFDLVFDQTDTMELGYLAEHVEYVFQTPCFNEWGRQIVTPAVSVADGKVTLSSSCFCVLRIKCQAIGHRHTVTMRLQKFEQEENEEGEINWTGYKIENIQNSIQATWMDEDGLQSDELDLAIPPCVEDYLAECEDGKNPGVIGGQGGLHYLLYYSTCTGRLLGVRSIHP